MALPAFPSSEADFLAQLNSDPYDASSNPYGLGAGGHRQLFPEGMDDIAIIANYVNDAGVHIDSKAAQVAIDAASAAAGSGTESTVANIRTGTSAQYLSIRNIYSANAPVALTDAATVAWDISTGINFSLTLGGNRAMGQPTGEVAGKSGILIVKQDATGSRLLTFPSQFVLFGGVPVLSVTPNSRAIFSYYVEAVDSILLMFGGNQI